MSNNLRSLKQRRVWAAKMLISHDEDGITVSLAPKPLRRPRSTGSWVLEFRRAALMAASDICPWPQALWVSVHLTIANHLLKIFPYYFYFIHNYNSTCQFKSTGGDYLDCNVCKRLWDSVDKESLVSVMSAWASDRWTGHMCQDHFPACSDHTASSLTGILAPKILPFKTFLPWGKGHARLQLRLQVSEWNTRSTPMWKSSGKSHAGTKGLHHCTEKNSFPKQGRNRHNEFSPTTFSGFHY